VESKKISVISLEVRSDLMLNNLISALRTRYDSHTKPPMQMRLFIKSWNVLYRIKQKLDDIIRPMIK